MGTRVWVILNHTRTHQTRWVSNFPIYVPMGIFLTHTLALIGFLPAGYAGNGYPLPSLSRPWIDLQCFENRSIVENMKRQLQLIFLTDKSTYIHQTEM